MLQRFIIDAPGDLEVELVAQSPEAAQGRAMFTLMAAGRWDPPEGMGPDEARQLFVIRKVVEV